jgi:adenine-specific DNA-methyltransferase
MPRSKQTKPPRKRSARKPIEQYEHVHESRLNNPPVGLVKPENDPEVGSKAYEYDPHLDPQLVWAGKAEHTSFEVPTVSLHVHERIDPKTILDAVRRQNGEAARTPQQLSIFERREEKAPLREALDFYKHAHGWKNRLVAGDSLLVISSLMEKEGMAGKVQMVYLDPPYGIRYGSNFQPFVNKREVKDGKDEDLTHEPEMIRAFRDTWELGIHSYLSYLRDRLLLSRELLHESGSIFVQISSENLARVSELMAEVFGAENLVEVISFRKKTMPLGGRLLEGISDYILWYARNKQEVKYRGLFTESSVEGDPHWNILVSSEGTTRRLTKEEINDHSKLPAGSDVAQLISLYPAGSFATGLYDFEFKGRNFSPPPGRSWKTPVENMRRLALAGRLAPYAGGKTLRYILRNSDYPVTPLSNLWADTSAPSDMRYVVETNTKVITRCLLMTTDAGDLIFDPTCGSGTTAYVAEQWGRRWITCDTSRVAITLAKQRLMTALYDYYELAHPEEGVGSGFRYRTVPHITLKSIANNPEIREGMSREAMEAAIAKYGDQESLYDQPTIDNSKARVAGPFTVEAVPAPVVKPLALTDESQFPEAADQSLARSGETLRHAEWREELLKTGIRGKAGQRIQFARVEPLAGTRWLHAEAETRPNDLGADEISDGGAASSALRVVISFGPEHAPLEQKQVERAWHEARSLFHRPALLAFAAFQFDPEAAKDIDELTPERAGMTLVKVQMNADLLTEDLKKKRASNESFWLMGQPDVELRRIDSGEHEGQWQVEVHGFDYYNTKTGGIESGDARRIALWMLDPSYDDRSLFPRQVFFPMAGESDGWSRLAKSLRAEIDEEAIEAYRGTVSLPFAAESGQRVAVKVIDDRGIESLRVLEVE